jgi:hypothetical protein
MGEWTLERPSEETTAGCRGDGAGVAAGSRGRVERARSPRAPESGACAAESKRETASARALDRVRSRDAILSFSLLSSPGREKKVGEGGNCSVAHARYRDFVSLKVFSNGPGPASFVCLVALFLCFIGRVRGRLHTVCCSMHVASL